LNFLFLCYQHTLPAALFWAKKSSGNKYQSFKYNEPVVTIRQ
jgi:hypothetical protein